MRAFYIGKICERNAQINEFVVHYVFKSMNALKAFEKY